MQVRDTVAGADGVTFYCVLCDKAFSDLPTIDPDEIDAARRERDEHEKKCPGSEEPVVPRGPRNG